MFESVKSKVEEFAERKPFTTLFPLLFVPCSLAAEAVIAVNGGHVDWDGIRSRLPYSFGAAATIGAVSYVCEPPKGKRRSSYDKLWEEMKTRMRHPER